MSRRSPPGTGCGWPRELGRIMDDDGRTRRAIALLWNVTAALLAIGAMTITVIQLVHLTGRYTGAGASLSIVIAAWRLRRTRR